MIATGGTPNIGHVRVVEWCQTHAREYAEFTVTDGPSAGTEICIEIGLN